jgi:hypothetical protein
MEVIKYEDYKQEILDLVSAGHSMREIARQLSAKHGKRFHDNPIGRNVRKWKPNAFDSVLDEAGFEENHTWDMGWLKTKGASIRLKNPQLNPEVIREQFLDAAKEAFANQTEWPTTPNVDNKGALFIPCIFDLHLGRLAWGEESGEDYDAKIASKRFREALSDLIHKARGYDVGHILFPVGNDIYNSDRALPYPQTTAGTPQMDDIRWQKLFRLGIQLITEAVLKLSEVAPVSVKMVYSNHDHERVFYLGETLTAVFQNSPSVDVDNNPTVRKYFKWGECLIGLAHGHNEKPQDLPLIMAQECKEFWGDTFYREWLLGHLHHRMKFLTQEAKDYRGVRVTYLTTPASPDAWHSNKAFTGAIKGAEGFLYDKSEGLIGTVVHNIK